MTNQSKTNVYFDALPLTTARLSGIGRLLSETVSSLSKDEQFLAKYNIILVAPRNRIERLQSLSFENVEFRQVMLPSKLWSGLIVFRLMPFVDLFLGKGVYVFANSTTWPLLKSKSITYVHDLNFIDNPETVKNKTYRIMRWNLSLWIRRATRLVAISQFTKSELVRLFGVRETKVTVVHCGVDGEVFYKRSIQEVEEVRSKYGIRNDYAVFLGNIEPRKNLERLLDAFILANNEKKMNASLVIIGADGWKNKSIMDKLDAVKSAGLDVVLPSNFVPDGDLPAILSGANVLVQPSLYEGFGMPPLEAMSCGTRVIVSKTTSLPEVAGGAGIYVDPLDIIDIAEKIQYAFTLDTGGDKVKLQEQARKFTWERAANNLESIIDDLVE
jgi:glycosyltransferase involved in cell wall biosynthesis